MADSPDIEFNAVQRIHLVGAGGAGMSALAKLLAGRGRIVSGSDLRASETLTRLAELGIETWAGHRPEALEAVDLVVASSAVPDRDAELRAAQEQGIPVWRRPRLLEAITREIPTIGVTGTHGKTSSTSMMVLALRAAGRDPSFVVGGEIVANGAWLAFGHGAARLLGKIAFEATARHHAVVVTCGVDEHQRARLAVGRAVRRNNQYDGTAVA